MRKVNRTPTPASLAGPKSAGGKERFRAAAFYRIKANRAKSFDFRAYKADDVREAMRAMFHKKCAYCETYYAPGGPEDVEHYRPKGSHLDHGRRQPGYWWLAMEWTNLLPSCIDCNRARKQKIVGKERKETAGKASQFPLARGSVRGTRSAGLTGEVPLLIDPTIDDPTEYLEFTADGSVLPVELGQVVSERGVETIKVVALQRGDLVEARKQAAEATEVAIRHVRNTLEDIRDAADLAPSDRRSKELKKLKERLDLDLADLALRQAPQTAYSAVALPMIERFKAEQGL